MEYKSKIGSVCHRGKFSILNYTPLTLPWGEETEMDLDNSLLYIWNYIQNIYLFMICALT